MDFLTHTELRLRVPGSTSNLGPGFDLLGLTVSLFLDVRLTSVDPGANEHELVRRDPGTNEHEPAPEHELLVRAFDHAADELGVEGCYHFDMSCGIPVGRGFGSSGAAVAAGLLLARALCDHPQEVARDQLLGWGIELEGHPDNVTASLFGGCTLCHPDPDGGAPAHISNAIAPSIGFALAWPTTPLSTAQARDALPRTVDFSDAVENPRRLALLLEGLRTGDARLLALGGEDRLHVAHRLPLIPGATQALAAARSAGAWLATISGAGSGLVALGERGRIGEIAEAMALALRAQTGAGEARVVDPVVEAPRVQRLQGTQPPATPEREA